MMISCRALVFALIFLFVSLVLVLRCASSSYALLLLFHRYIYIAPRISEQTTTKPYGFGILTINKIVSPSTGPSNMPFLVLEVRKRAIFSNERTKKKETAFAPQIIHLVCARIDFVVVFLMLAPIFSSFSLNFTNDLVICVALNSTRRIWITVKIAVYFRYMCCCIRQSKRQRTVQNWDKKKTKTKNRLNKAEARNKLYFEKRNSAKKINEAFLSFSLALPVCILDWFRYAPNQRQLGKTTAAAKNEGNWGENRNEQQTTKPSVVCYAIFHGFWRADLVFVAAYTSFHFMLISFGF